MKYQIIDRLSAETLEKDVQAWLNQGWKLQGGVSIALSPGVGNRVFVQAVIKEDKDENN